MPPLYTEDSGGHPFGALVKAVPGKFSCWDKTIIQGPMTLGQIIEKYKADFDVTITMIACGRDMLYNDYAGNQ